VPARNALAPEEREFFGIDYQAHGLVFLPTGQIPLRPDRVTVESVQRVAACGLLPCPPRNAV
jgi:hypothetical protein